MFRKTMLALAATAALGAAALTPTAASAGYFGYGYGYGHGHFHGFRGLGITVVSPRYASCWRSQWIETRRGLRRVMVNVCDY